MQVPHPAWGMCQSRAQGAPILCIQGANGVSDGAPRCHSMAEQAAAALHAAHPSEFLSGFYPSPAGQGALLRRYQ